MKGSAVLADLSARGLVHNTTDQAELAELLDAGPVSVYCGFDPTANSLHLGNLFPLLLLRRFQLFGHRPIALAGGATGMIGDPGGRSDERNLLDAETLNSNLVAVKQQLQSFLDFGTGDHAGQAGTQGEFAVAPAILVDNRDWTEGVGVLEFLRDVGKHVTVNTMLAKESIKARVDSENGISFTEFSYMLLQAHDYLQLFRSEGCLLQVGGSDQWGNITAGTDLIRRVEGETAHALTCPLLTQADGSKFGKSVGGAVWLDPEKTLPYEMHQYLLNAGDADVEKLLLQLTLVPVEEIAEVVELHERNPSDRVAQRRLADEVVAMVHGVEQADRAALAGEALFGAADLTPEMLEALRGVVPETSVSIDDFGDEALIGFAVTSGLASSNGDARKTLKQNGFAINRVKTDSTAVSVDQLVGQRFLLLQKGKKNRHLLIVE